STALKHLQLSELDKRLLMSIKHHTKKEKSHGRKWSEVEFENDRVKVIRVTTGRCTRSPQTTRHDRLLTYLHDGDVIRTENGKQEEIRRTADEVVWRDRSQHQIENLKDTHHEALIIEFK